MPPLASLGLTLILTIPFLFGKRMALHESWQRRLWVSISAGVSIAYVFVHIFPELSEQQGILAQMEGYRLPFILDVRVYLAALIGFLLYYGLDSIVFASSHTPPASPGAEHRDRLITGLHLGGFAVYCAIVSYLLIDWNRGVHAALIYCCALALHFLIVDHAFRQEYGAVYDRVGRWVFAVAILVGWGIGILYRISPSAMAYTVGFLSGGIVINSIKDELPKSEGGTFWAFTLGALAYSILLII